jgi:hypothetical protein
MPCSLVEICDAAERHFVFIVKVKEKVQKHVFILYQLTSRHIP